MSEDDIKKICKETLVKHAGTFVPIGEGYGELDYYIESEAALDAMIELYKTLHSEPER